MSPLLVASLVLLSPLVREGAWNGGRIPMVFSGTEVGHALKALGLRTGTDVVYAAGKDKLLVSLNVTAATPEEAIRCVASAAGLVYRRVGKLYVVAPPAGMRQALEPYGVRAVFPVEGGATPETVAALQEAFPYTTVRAAGDRIVVVGTEDEVVLAHGALTDLQTGSATRRASADVVVLAKAIPATIAPLLASLYPDVKITATPGDKPGGALALTGPATSIRSARATAEKLDADMSVDATVFRVYELRYAGASDVVDFLRQAAPKVEAFASPQPYLPKRAAFNPMTSGVGSAGGGGAMAASGGTTTATGSTGTSLPPTAGASNVSGGRETSIVLHGVQSDVDAALRLLAQVDRKPKQVVVEVNVVETSPENDEAVGIAYDWTKFSFYEVPKGSLVSDAPLSTKPSGVGGFSRVPWNFNATLSAMVTRKEARILAKPSLRVVDNGQASVFIGDTIRARIVTGGALGAQNVDIQEFPVGIILLIAPRVNADGNITMHVNPVVSTVTSIDADNVPQTSSREAETTAIVKDGETVVLGGLIRDEDIKTVQEIPLLSKLPLVGELFRNRVRNHRRSDILVSITPHIVDDETVGAAKP